MLVSKLNTNRLTMAYFAMTIVVSGNYRRMSPGTAVRITPHYVFAAQHTGIFQADSQQLYCTSIRALSYCPFLTAATANNIIKARQVTV